MVKSSICLGGGPEAGVKGTQSARGQSGGTKAQTEAGNHANSQQRAPGLWVCIRLQPMYAYRCKSDNIRISRRERTYKSEIGIHSPK